jgi:hypothetical protein
MSGIDYQTSSYQTPLPSKVKPPFQNVSKDQTQTNSASQESASSEPKALPSNEQELDNFLKKQEYHQRYTEAVKAQNQKSKDIFQRATNGVTLGDNLSVAEYAAQINQKKKQEEDFKKSLERSNEANIGDNPETESTLDKKASLNASLAGSIAQIHQDSLDPDERNENNEVDRILSMIDSRGGEAGKKFADFAKTQIEKGRLSEIRDLIIGFYENLEVDSLTASGMIREANEPVNLLKHMVNSENSTELNAINYAITSRPDTPASLKRDFLTLRNKTAQERTKPPAYAVIAKPNKVENAIGFILTIQNSSLIAPWDRVA